MERGLRLLRSGVPQDYDRRLGAGRAESFVAMKSFVRLAMAVAQYFYLLHLIVVFFSAGKEFKQPGFKQFVRVGRPSKKLASSRA